MKGLARNTVLFAVGGTGYVIIELLFRQHSHPTMFVAGGICFSAIENMNCRCQKLSLIKRCGISSLIITGVEFIFGCVFNLGLGWKVWDYSALPMNVMGQICPLFTALWFLLSAPVIWIGNWMEKNVLKSMRLPRLLRIPQRRR